MNKNNMVGADESPVFKATVFAAHAHSGQYRKGTQIPYLCHPLDVARELVRLGCDDRLVAAGVLHDVIEDTAVTRDELALEFGEEITCIVETVSFRDQGDGWRGKKQRTLDALAAVDNDALLVAAADKLCNLRDIAADYALAGDDVWNRFNGKKDGARWYYRELTAVFTKRCTGTPASSLAKRIGELVEYLLPVAAGADAGGKP